MMKRNNILSLLALALLCSCTSDWDDHYDTLPSVSRQNLLQTIAGDSQLSGFHELLKATGYDSILASSQTYTVYAPTNEALTAESLQDDDARLRIVRNHIARYANPTSIGTDRKVYMLNGKSLTFGSASEFGGAPIVAANQTAQNGVLHKLSGMIPYKYNIREYIDTHPECSAISEFIARFDTLEYDETMSTTYDSVFVKYNALLQHPKYGVGDLENEDSLLMMVVPENGAWQKAYDALSPAFTNYKADALQADSVRDVQTAQTLVRALAARNLDETLLSQYERIEASNGVIWLARNEVTDIDTCLTHAVISVEAEDMDGRSNMSGTSAYVRNADINSAVQGISDNSYLEVSSGNVDGGVIFDVPNVLSQTYDVYVDFVSPVIDGEALAEQKTKVSFQLRHANAQGRTTTVNNNTATEVNATMGDIITIKAFSNVKLPVADYYDKLWLSAEGNSLSDIAETTTLQVRTRVSSTDARKGYVRLFRVDRIRFVPVTTNPE
ncbi:MAG: fasciclin domain-containing protein [Prevotella sp.]